MSDEQKNQRATFKFRYEPSNAAATQFIRYLRVLEQDTGTSPQESLLIAARAFYMPEALAYFGETSEDALRRVALNSMAVLLEQASLLAKKFNFTHLQGAIHQQGLGFLATANGKMDGAANHNGQLKSAQAQASAQLQEASGHHYQAHLAQVDAEVNSLLEGIDEILP